MESYLGLMLEQIWVCLMWVLGVLIMASLSDFSSRQTGIY